MRNREWLSDKVQFGITFHCAGGPHGKTRLVSSVTNKTGSSFNIYTFSFTQVEMWE